MGFRTAKMMWVATATMLLIFGGRTTPVAAAVESDPFRFAPPDSAAVIRGREVATRFGLTQRYELLLHVNNAFSGQNRQAIAHAEASIAAIPGIWKVAGPGGLLAITVDREGHPSPPARLLSAGKDDDASEELRQRLVRRSDAIGWFVSRDGKEIRLLVDTGDMAAVQPAVRSAVMSSGLVLLDGDVSIAPLFPDPAQPPYPFPPWLPFALLALGLGPIAAGVGFGSRISIPRALVVIVAAAVGASSPLMLAPAVGVRQFAGAAGFGAAGLVAASIVLGRVRAHLRGGRQTRSAPIRFRVTWPIALSSMLLMVGALVLSKRVSLGTQLWRETPLFFVEVRADIDDPMVLREVRRLTDFLRAEPGVTHAWSIADLFFATPAVGETFGGIPYGPDSVRSILVAARDDSAVHLELAPDHRSALVGVRWDDDSGVDRLKVLARLRRYLQRGFRSSLLRVDVLDSHVSPSVRGLARGILAADTRERMLRICERSGRMLSESDVQTIERAVRRATLLPVFDLAKLKIEVADEVTAFLHEFAGARTHPADAPGSVERKRLVEELAALPADVSIGGVIGPLRTFWGRRVSEPVLRVRGSELEHRLAAVRRLNGARLNFDEILYGADLPTEGVLSEEVRDATLDAMGPMAVLPVGRDVPGALLIDADAVGGVACDGALSTAWRPRMALGMAIAAGLIALLLLAVGGLTALAWWPVALALGAPLIVVPAIAAMPIGVLYVAVLAGAIAGGATLAVCFAPGRRDR